MREIGMHPIMSCRQLTVAAVSGLQLAALWYTFRAPPVSLRGEFIGLLLAGAALPYLLTGKQLSPPYTRHSGLNFTAAGRDGAEAQLVACCLLFSASIDGASKQQARKRGGREEKSAVLCCYCCVRYLPRYATSGERKADLT